MSAHSSRKLLILLALTIAGCAGGEGDDCYADGTCDAPYAPVRWHYQTSSSGRVGRVCYCVTLRNLRIDNKAVPIPTDGGSP